VFVLISALLARQPEMGALKGIGHAARGYAKGLHYERAEDKGQDEGGYQPFERVCNFGCSVLSLWCCGARTTLFGCLWRHKQKPCRRTNSVSVNSGPEQKPNYARKSDSGQQKLFYPPLLPSRVLSCGQPVLNGPQQWFIAAGRTLSGNPLQNFFSNCRRDGDPFAGVSVTGSGDWLERVWIFF